MCRFLSDIIFQWFPILLFSGYDNMNPNNFFCFWCIFLYCCCFIHEKYIFFTLNILWQYYRKIEWVYKLIDNKKKIFFGLVRTGVPPKNGNFSPQFLDICENIKKKLFCVLLLKISMMVNLCRKKYGNCGDNACSFVYSHF